MHKINAVIYLRKHNLGKPILGSIVLLGYADLAYSFERKKRGLK